MKWLTNVRGSLQKLAAGLAQKTGAEGWYSILSDGGKSSADLTRPYQQSVWVSAAIGHLSKPLQAVPLKFSTDRRGGDVVVEDPALTAFWEKPAKTRGGLMNRADFLEATVAWLSMKGESFWIMDDTWLRPGMKKNPLIVARPQDMRPVLGDSIYGGNRQELIGWEWTAAEGRKEWMTTDNVVHLKYFNPYNEIRGLAPWEAARIAADSDYAAAVFARNLMQNNGDRGPYIIGKDGAASKEQQQQITAMLRQKREMTRQGDFRAMFLTGDIDVKEPGLTSVDTAYIAQRIQNRHEIFAAFGVPMSYAEVMASYSIGSASDRFRLIEDGSKPLGTKIADGIEIVSAAFLGYPVFAEFDWDEHSTMQAVRAERIDVGAKLVDRGMPWKNVSDYLRLKLPGFKGDDIGRVPFNLQEIGGEDEADDTETPPVKDDDSVDNLEKLFQRMPIGEAPKKSGCPDCGGDHEPTPAETKAGGEGKENAQWLTLRAKRKPWEKKLTSIMGRLLMDARAETLRNLATAVAAEEGKSIETKSLDVLGIVFNLGTWLPKWAKGLTDAERAMMEAAGFELWTEELGKDDPLTMSAAEVNTAIALRENRLRGAGTKIWERVKADLQKAVDQGLPNAQLEQAIKASFRGISDTRVQSIAQTETTVVYETGRHMVMKQAGVQWKQWLHSGLSDNARPKHQAAHEQIRELSEPYDIGGVPMMFPGDPEAEADEVVGCKCVSVAVAGPDQDDIEGNDNDDIPY